MINLNRVLIGGNLTKKPEITRTTNGSAVCKLSLAYNEVKKAGEKVTYYFNIVCFGSIAENCEKYLEKGSSVLVEGKIINRSYKANDGSNKTITEINASSVSFLSRPKSKAEEQPQQGNLDY